MSHIREHVNMHACFMMRHTSFEMSHIREQVYTNVCFQKDWPLCVLVYWGMYGKTSVYEPAE